MKPHADTGALPATAATPAPATAASTTIAAPAPGPVDNVVGSARAGHATDTQATQATQASAPIPFRQTGVTSGADAAGTLAITVALLAVGAAGAWYARKRGWLDRWAATPAGAAASTRRLAVAETLRLSRATTVYRIADGQREYLVLESGGTARQLAGVVPAEATA